ncbi:hypothetical protein DL98DRAFT_571010 [Cadophora sp. DSE1049]|nr:hypothetical protein DL98DRAFT_571010 [Cadophora sp. DSE1049]
MIDDTQNPSGVEYPYSLSAEIVEISKHQTDRNDALQWARNLRFLAYDDSYDDEIQKRQQNCAVCHATLKVKPLEQRDILEHKLHHVCDTPFHSNHISSPEELKTSPMRFNCDVCHRGIWAGSRHHCGQCLSGKYEGSFDLCDACLTAGSHCLDPDHDLEKIPIFKFGECVHVNARSCGDCEKIPLFPNEGEATKFQIVQLKNGEDSQAAFSNCEHFVAVSYCWPPPQYDAEGNFIQHRGRYSVKDLQGRVRPNRAPEDVITRAAEFAAQNGIRLIWIDQECIDQEDPADKELGIQVMDKVYQRAFLSIGLLRTRIESQDTLRVLKHFGPNSDGGWGFSAAEISTHDLVESMITFFEHIMKDPWHTRAWVLQEAYSAGPRMVLLFQHAPGISMSGHRTISTTLSVSEIAVHFDSFIILVDYATGFLTRSLAALAITDDLAQRRLSLLQQFKMLPPGDERSINIKWTYRVGSARPRRSCNAAVALSYLRTRGNTHIPDRLAIMANLCNYDVRLNTIEIEKNHQHLGPCVFALALINGDFSLLYPEVYKGLENFKGCKIDNNEFSWLRTTPNHLGRLEARFLNTFTYNLPSPSTNDNITSAGLSVPGYLWKVDRKIHFPEFLAEQMRPAKATWFRTRQTNLTVQMLRDPSNTSQTWGQQCTNSSVFDDLDDDLKESLAASANRAKNLTTEQYETFAALYRFSILAQVSDSFESTFFKDTVTWLLLILYMLRQRGEIDVADSIWHSVRADKWDVSLSSAENQRRGCFNSVADFPPFDFEGIVPIDKSVAMDMFQLDWDRDGALQQCWIVDSLLRDGYLSVGKLVRVSSHDEFQFHPEWFREEDEVQPDEDIMEYVDSTITSTMASLGLSMDMMQEPGQSVPNSTILLNEDKTAVAAQIKTAGSSALEELLRVPDLADTKLFQQLMMSKFISRLADIPLQSIIGPTPHQPTCLDEHNRIILGAAKLYIRMATDWTPNGLTRLKSMRAVFNLQWDEGEQVKWVFTPYDQISERLPHAEARSLSMSWIVKPTEQCPDGKEGVRQVLRTKGTVKGMWRFMDSPMTRYLLV